MCYARAMWKELDSQWECSSARSPNGDRSRGGLELLPRPFLKRGPSLPWTSPALASSHHRRSWLFLLLLQKNFHWDHQNRMLKIIKKSGVRSAIVDQPSSLSFSVVSSWFSTCKPLDFIEIGAWSNPLFSLICRMLFLIFFDDSHHCRPLTDDPLSMSPQPTSLATSWEKSSHVSR